MQSPEQRIEYFIGKLKGDYSKRRYTANASVQIGNSTVEPPIEALAREDESTRRASAQTLGRIVDTRAVELLIVALNDTKTLVFS